MSALLVRKDADRRPVSEAHGAGVQRPVVVAGEGRLPPVHVLSRVGGVVKQLTPSVVGRLPVAHFGHVLEHVAVLLASGALPLADAGPPRRRRRTAPHISAAYILAHLHHFLDKIVGHVVEMILALLGALHLLAAGVSFGACVSLFAIIVQLRLRLRLRLRLIALLPAPRARPLLLHDEMIGIGGEVIGERRDAAEAPSRR
mmetsp:Transcript_49391/g.148796  ORF Transcript_49391/g.148796 Transcript_49391/m.148796 type:complete len:201 (-) Transcript_49391:1062-1664(-)